METLSPYPRVSKPQQLPLGYLELCQRNHRRNSKWARSELTRLRMWVRIWHKSQILSPPTSPGWHAQRSTVSLPSPHPDPFPGPCAGLDQPDSPGQRRESSMHLTLASLVAEVVQTYFMVCMRDLHWPRARIGLPVRICYI